MCGQIAYDWKTIPSRRSLAETSVPASASKSARPPTNTVPASGRSSPAMQRRVVVFPQPDGPSSERNAPSSIVERHAANGLDGAEGLPEPGDVQHHRPAPRVDPTSPPRESARAPSTSAGTAHTIPSAARSRNDPASYSSQSRTPITSVPGA